jgi:hypothetical protein
VTPWRFVQRPLSEDPASYQDGLNLYSSTLALAS